MKRKSRKEKHCFINELRPCTLKCKSAFQRKGEIDCTILWALNNMGWSASAWAKKAYSEYRKSTPKKK